MKEKLFHYDGEAIEVIYDLNRCIHAAACVNGLPSVFNPKQTPWVDPAAASAEELAQTIETCPSGALKYRFKDGSKTEQPAAVNTIQIESDGPVHIRGNVVLLADNGDILQEETRVTLCRCGASQNKPFCDGAHEKAGFKDSGNLGTHNLQPAASTDGVLRIKLANNAPLLLDGPFTLSDASGETEAGGAKGALCRCGASNNKPFCDGTHRNIGFDSQGY